MRVGRCGCVCKGTVLTSRSKHLLLLLVHCVCIVCALFVCAERQQQRLKTERKVKVVKKCKLVAKAVQSFWKKVDKIVTFKNQATVSMVVVVASGGGGSG